MSGRMALGHRSRRRCRCLFIRALAGSSSQKLGSVSARLARGAASVNKVMIYDCDGIFADTNRRH